MLFARARGNTSEVEDLPVQRGVHRDISLTRRAKAVVETPRACSRSRYHDVARDVILDADDALSVVEAKRAVVHRVCFEPIGEHHVGTGMNIAGTGNEDLRMAFLAPLTRGPKSGRDRYRAVCGVHLVGFTWLDCNCRTRGVHDVEPFRLANRVAADDFRLVAADDCAAGDCRRGTRGSRVRRAGNNVAAHERIGNACRTGCDCIAGFIRVTCRTDGADCGGREDDFVAFVHGNDKAVGADEFGDAAAAVGHECGCAAVHRDADAGGNGGECGIVDAVDDVVERNLRIDNGAIRKVKLCCHIGLAHGNSLVDSR